MNRSRKTNPSHIRRLSKRQSLLLLLLIVVVVAALAQWGKLPGFHKTHSNSGAAGGNSPTLITKSGSKVDLSPGTPAEQQQIDKQKGQQTTQPVTNESSGSQSLKKVSVFITSTSLPVRAYASGIIEDGGTCTATFTQGTTTISKSSTGLANVSYTSCPPISPNLSKGKWSVVVSYKSSTAYGTSGAQSIEVQ